MDVVFAYVWLIVIEEVFVFRSIERTYQIDFLEALYGEWTTEEPYFKRGEETRLF